MAEASRRLGELTSSACLVKGGHLVDGAVDILFDGHRIFKFKKRKLPVEVHGTGCFLSSAILCFLADGWSLPLACQKAIDWLQLRLRSPLKISRGLLLEP